MSQISSPIYQVNFHLPNESSSIVLNTSSSIEKRLELEEAVIECTYPRVITITLFALSFITSTGLIIAGMMTAGMGLLIAGIVLMGVTCAASIIYTSDLQKQSLQVKYVEYRPDGAGAVLDVRIEQIVNQAIPSSTEIVDAEVETDSEINEDNNSVENSIELSLDDYVLPPIGSKKKDKAPQGPDYLGSVKVRGELSIREENLEKVEELFSAFNSLESDLDDLERQVAIEVGVFDSLSLSSQSGARASAPPPPPPMNGPRAGSPPPPPPPPGRGAPQRAQRTEIQESTERLSSLYDEYNIKKTQYNYHLMSLSTLIFGQHSLPISIEELSAYVERFKQLSGAEIERLNGLLEQKPECTGSSVSEIALENDQQNPASAVIARFRKLIKDYETTARNIQTLRAQNELTETRISNFSSQIALKKAHCLTHVASGNSEEQRRETIALEQLSGLLARAQEEKKTRQGSLNTKEINLNAKLKQLKAFAGVQENDWTIVKPRVLEKIRQIESGEAAFEEETPSAMTTPHRRLREHRFQALDNGSPAVSRPTRQQSLLILEQQQAQRAALTQENHRRTSKAREVMREIELDIQALEEVIQDLTPGSPDFLVKQNEKNELLENKEAAGEYLKSLANLPCDEIQVALFLSKYSLI